LTLGRAPKSVVVTAPAVPDLINISNRRRTGGVPKNTSSVILSEVVKNTLCVTERADLLELRSVFVNRPTDGYACVSNREIELNVVSRVVESSGYVNGSSPGVTSHR
jgi:hypothetical protein